MSHHFTIGYFNTIDGINAPYKWQKNEKDLHNCYYTRLFEDKAYITEVSIRGRILAVHRWSDRRAAGVVQQLVSEICKLPARQND